MDKFELLVRGREMEANFDNTEACDSYRPGSARNNILILSAWLSKPGFIDNTGTKQKTEGNRHLLRSTFMSTPRKSENQEEPPVCRHHMQQLDTQRTRLP